MLINALPARSSRFVFMLMILAAGVLVVVSLSWRMVLASPADAVLGQPLVAQAPLLAPKTYTVTTTADGGVGSLRQAILGSESNLPGPNMIVFNIPGTGVHSIAPLTPLPDMLVPVLIDGYTQPGASPNTLAAGNNAVLRIELVGSSGNGKLYGLQLSGGGSSVRGLAINRFITAGILLDSNGGDVVAGNFIGTNISGTQPLSNAVGIDIAGVSANTIGGPAPADRNLLSGNSSYGLYIFATFTLTPTNNLVQGNYIGTNAAGTAALGNGNGVGINGGISNTIGAPGAVSTTVATIANPSGVNHPVTDTANLVSGNEFQGVGFYYGANSNLVAGNFIGTDFTGNFPLPNGGNAIYIFDSSNMMIGGWYTPTLGGPCLTPCNIIGYSGGFAMDVERVSGPADGNSFLGNFTRANVGGVIAFGGDPVPHDNPGCSDAPEPNNWINSPTVTFSGNSVKAYVLCKPNTRYLVQIYESGTGPNDISSPWDQSLVESDGSGYADYISFNFYKINKRYTATVSDAFVLAATKHFLSTSKYSPPFTPHRQYLPLTTK